jgi:poly(glycerol-phosphate) alpha-glucosyltransferase
MHVTHVTASVTASGGGIPVVLQCLAAAQASAGLRPRVVGHEDGGTAMEGWPADCPTALPTRRIPGLPWATRLSSTLRDGAPEIMHTHGLWSQASVVVPRVARRAGVPYVVSPHGMLDPWALANARWKKRIAARLFEDRHLRGAACLFALCQSEADSIRAYGLRNPVAVIPNGVELPEMQRAEGGDLRAEAGNLKAEGGDLKAERRILLFLGRLHPKKGLVNALKAWSEIRGQRSEVRGQGEWQFVIAGWDQGGHEAELKELATSLGIPWADVRDLEADHSVESLQFQLSAFSFQLSAFSLLFTGPAFGHEKDQLLRRATAFILPSFSEGLPMSVLEAWAYRLPVLMTEHCNLPEGFAAGAALRIGTDVASIAEGLRTLFQLPSSSPTRHQEQRTAHGSRSDLRSLGQSGRALVERQFTWPQVARQMSEVYAWVLGQGPKPDCVRE